MSYFLPIFNKVINISKIGEELALPGYYSEICFIKELLYENTIEPPTGTIKFLSVDCITKSSLLFFMVRLI
jgi:hypothetical protein